MAAISAYMITLKAGTVTFGFSFLLPTRHVSSFPHQAAGRLCVYTYVNSECLCVGIYTLIYAQLAYSSFLQIQALTIILRKTSNTNMYIQSRFAQTKCRAINRPICHRADTAQTTKHTLLASHRSGRPVWEARQKGQRSSDLQSHPHPTGAPAQPRPVPYPHRAPCRAVVYIQSVGLTLQRQSRSGFAVYINNPVAGQSTPKLVEKNVDN